ncbi:RNA-binding protein 26-like, partial [Tropilaelaps mercedesae]
MISSETHISYALFGFYSLSFYRSRSRSRSRERYRAGRKGRSRTPPPARHRGRLPVRHSRSRSRSPPQPLRDLRDTLTRKHNTSLATNVHITGRRDRCRDFDEQGFCIQGELCPYDHGADPVILDSTVPPPYNPTMRGGNGVPISPIVPEYNPLEPDMRRPHAQPHAHDHPVHPHPPGHHHLGPTSPYASAGGVSGSSWNYQPGPPTGPAGVPGSGGSHVQRELVAIPRNNLTQVQRTVVVPPHENHNSNARGGPLSRFQRGTELEVRRIPRQQNNIATLNEYFSKFGIITNIQVNFQGCAESALISFSKHHEANAAYRSTDAVLGNRFIRLFWHNPANNNVSSGSGTAPGGNQVPHGNNHNNNTSVLVGQLKKRLQLQQQRGVSGQEDIGAVPKKIAKPNPEALKKDNQADKSAQLISQKSRLIDKYVEENKRLLERLEKCNSDTEREQIKTMIANMTKIIEGLRPKVAPGALLPEITSEKQLLDAELDLYRQMQASKQGQNPAEAKQLEAKLLALRRQAKTLGLLDAANVWHGRLGHKGLLVGQTTTASKVSASGKVQPGQLAIDKRPRVVAILAGQLEMAGLCKHLSRYGKVANVAEEGEGDSKYFLFTFATRKDAEYAVNRGGQFRGAPLKWHWKEDPHAQFAKSTSLSKDIESREDSILDLKDQDDPAAEI